MLTKLMNNVTTTFYIQIWKDRFKVTNLKSGHIYEDLPYVAIEKDQILAIGQKASTYLHAINPFAHPRIIVDDFEMASILFRYAMEQASQRKAFFSPLGIIQVMDEFDTKLTKIEKKALIEISMAAGCRESIVYEGKKSDMKNINFNELKKEAFACNK